MNKNKYETLMRALKQRYVKGRHFHASESDLQEFEKTIGFPLPKDYREFLAEYGFSASEGRLLFVYPDDDVGSGVNVEVFFGLGSGDTYDLLLARDRLIRLGKINLLPVATSAGGKHCIVLAGEDAGKIFWHTPEEEDLIYESSGFDEFLRRLVVITD